MMHIRNSGSASLASRVGYTLLVLSLCLGLGACGASSTETEGTTQEQPLQESPQSPDTESEDSADNVEEAIEPVDSSSTEGGSEDEKTEDKSKEKKADGEKAEDEKAEGEKAEEKKSERDAQKGDMERLSREELIAKGLSDRRKPFWGVWTLETKKIKEATEYSKEAKKLGFASEVFLTTDWSSLDEEPNFVVSLACMDTFEEAEAIRQRATVAGYEDPYVQHSGDFVEAFV